MWGDHGGNTSAGLRVLRLGKIAFVFRNWRWMRGRNCANPGIPPPIGQESRLVRAEAVNEYPKEEIGPLWSVATRTKRYTTNLCFCQLLAVCCVLNHPLDSSPSPIPEAFQLSLTLTKCLTGPSPMTMKGKRPIYNCKCRHFQAWVNAPQRARSLL
jgi:hypothetical protein